MSAVKNLDYSFDVDQLELDTGVILQMGDINRQNQLCLTYCPTKNIHPDGELHQGAGSLHYEMRLKGETVYKHNRPKPLSERDFTDFIPFIKHLYVYEVYKRLREQFNIGRMRLIKLNPGQCLTWHRDVSQRIHIPIQTNPGNRLVVDDRVYFLPAGKAYLVNTTLMHTAFNGGSDVRYNILVSTVPTEEEERTFLESYKK